MGISAVASYIGGALIDVVDLDASVVARCFPTAAAWPGRTTLADLAERQLRRRAAALAIPEPAAGREPRLPDPGFARFRADGEAHLFSPRIATEITLLAVGGPDGVAPDAIDDGSPATGRRSPGPHPTAPSRATSFGSGAPRLPSRSPRSRTRGRSCGGSWSRR